MCLLAADDFLSFESTRALNYTKLFIPGLPRSGKSQGRLDFIQDQGKVTCVSQSILLPSQLSWTLEQHAVQCLAQIS